jgi:putative phosphoesterase
MRFLPEDAPASQVRACFGVISDTHMPQRWASLPPAVEAVFRGVELILHAGDLGELWVLDELSRIAPVVAVHGNDETADAKRELPYQQVITAYGQRLVLCHSHHPDRAQEMALRQNDAWQPILERRLDFGRRAGASVVIYGHTHIPMTYREDGVLLLNPGAIASGSVTTRQRRKTVALLYLLDDRSPLAVHLDLAEPTHPFMPRVDWAAGFRTALDQYNATLIDPELASGWAQVEAAARTWMEDPARAASFEVLYAALLHVAHRCWAGEQEHITRSDVLDMLDGLGADGRLAAADIEALRSSLNR